MDGEAVLLAKEGVSPLLWNLPIAPKRCLVTIKNTLCAIFCDCTTADETLSQTLPDVIRELTVLSAHGSSRGMTPEAHPLPNGVRLEISRFQWRG